MKIILTNVNLDGTIGIILLNPVFFSRLERPEKAYDMPQTLAETFHLQLGDSLPEMIAAARKGVPMRAVEALGKALRISLQEMADILPVSYRSLKRYSHDHVLSKDLSAHVLELGRVFVRATETFGNEDSARRWMLSPCQALGGVTPFSMLDTTLGAEAVLDELLRIEHGVYY